MSTHDLVIDDANGTAFLADLNLAIKALGTRMTNATEPTITYVGQLWRDTTAGLLKERNAANTGWIVKDTLDETFVIDRAANTILGAKEMRKLIRATAPFTQTFTAAATLADGWLCAYRVESGAVVILDPNGAELIDGATTKTITGPATGFIYCNGTAFYTVGFVALQTTFTNPDYTDQTLTDAATIAWDMSLGNIAAVTITASRTLGLPTNPKRGTVVLKVIQNATGGWTLTLPSAFKHSAGVAPVIAGGANQVTILSYFCDGTNYYGGVAVSNAA